MIQPIQTTVVPIPDDVLVFAEAQGVSSQLPAVVELVQRIYPKATLSVEVEDDPEIPNDRHIVINAEGVDLPVSEALAKREQLLHGLFACCPAPLVCTFSVLPRGFR